MNKSSASWLQMTLEVDAELAESVAEVLARYIENGVVIESTRAKDGGEEKDSPSASLRVYGYIPVDEDLENTRKRIEQGLRSLALIQPIPAPSYSTITESNWMEAWKQHYEPILIGQRLLILPAWIDQAPGERLPIRIEPGMAFGTGVHPSTQLSLHLLESYLQPGQSMIDLGCGSGILSIAAARLGADPILGVDIDSAAVENARHNAKLNSLEIRFENASLEEIQRADFGIQKADVVVANILAPVLIHLLEEGLGKLLLPKATLILSGILLEQEESLLGALNTALLSIREIRRMGDWLALAANL